MEDKRVKQFLQVSTSGRGKDTRKGKYDRNIMHSCLKMKKKETQ
jgi:hypothetical protein